MTYADVVIIVFFVVAIIILTCVVFSRRKYQSKNVDINIKEEAIKTRNSWLRTSVLCIAAYYGCILCSIFSTLTVLHISCFEESISNELKYRIIFLSILSIFTSICPYVVDLKQMSKLYRNAFRVLDEAILKNEDLAEAITQGEKELDPIL